VFRRERKTDEAIAEYRLAIEKDSKLAKAYYDLGILYAQERKTAEAREAFENYLKNGAGEDAASRKDAEDRLKTLKSERP
jgi:Flp pilus assembly protein TadD